MKQTISRFSHFKLRLLGMAILGGVLLLNTVLSAGVLAKTTGVFFVSPASGSYQQGAQFSVTISYSNADRLDNPLIVSFQPRPNLQYISTGFNNGLVTSPQIKSNSDGSFTLTVTAGGDHRRPFNGILATVTLKALTVGQASFTLSGGSAGGSGATVQSGKYNILGAPAPTPTPTPTPTPKPTPTPTPVPSSTTPAKTSAPTTSVTSGSTTPRSPIKTNQDSDVLPLLTKNDPNDAATTPTVTGTKSGSAATSTQNVKTKQKNNLLIPIIATVSVGMIILLAWLRRRPAPFPPVEFNDRAVVSDDVVSQPLTPQPAITVIPEAPQNMPTPLPLATPPVFSQPPVIPASQIPAAPPPIVVPLPPIAQSAEPQPLTVTPQSIPHTPPPPVSTMPQPIPYANTVMPTSKNPLEAKINEAFYPLTTHPPTTPTTSTDEPLDMFEMAKRYPQSYGNDLYVGGTDTPSGNQPPDQSPKQPPRQK